MSKDQLEKEWVSLYVRANIGTRMGDLEKRGVSVRVREIERVWDDESINNEKIRE